MTVHLAYCLEFAAEQTKLRRSGHGNSWRILVNVLVVDVRSKPEGIC